MQHLTFIQLVNEEQMRKRNGVYKITYRLLEMLMLIYRYDAKIVHFEKAFLYGDFEEEILYGVFSLLEDQWILNFDFGQEYLLIGGGSMSVL